MIVLELLLEQGYHAVEQAVKAVVMEVLLLLEARKSSRSTFVLLLCLASGS